MSGSAARHEVLTLADLVINTACSVRTSLRRVTSLALDAVDDGSWNRLTVEYALLHLYLLSEHAHQVLEEEAALKLVSEVADRVSQGLAHRLGPTRIDQRAVGVYFGATLKERFATYQRLPIVVDPEAGEVVEVESFDRLRGTVFGRFVLAVAPLVSPGQELPPGAALDLWLDSLTRSEAFARIYTPIVDLVAANLRATERA